MEIEFLMIVVGISMSLATFPQIYKLYKNKRSNDVSLLYLIVIMHGLGWWLYYGVLKDSFSLIFTNALSLLFYLVVLVQIIYYRR